MIFFTAGFGLLLHIIFWGVGLALLLTPRPWNRYALIFAPAFGLALQSAVVWWGANLGFAGTDAYAKGSEVLPALLLVAGVWRVGWRNCRGVVVGVRRSAGVWLAVAVTLNALLIPMTTASKTLTTMSLGSCDAADYAAGARVLQEFAQNDRVGFIGQTETVSVGHANTFFEYWMRLNHFTPSALLALNDSVFGLKIYESTSVMTAVLLAVSLPMVFWLTRAGLRLGPAASVIVACFYGASPVVWYAVAHVAMGQLLAAIAIALLTWCGLVQWRTKARWRQGWKMAGLLMVAYWLLLGAYNFIIVVALVPAAAYAGGRALVEGAWMKLVRWCVLMTAPLLVTGLVFSGRVVGLIERFQLLQQYDFGWEIPALTPEGWLGMVADEHLHGHPDWLRWLLAGGVLFLLTVTLIRAMWRGEDGVFVVFCVTVPILIGYWYLVWRGAKLGTRASYDAYKLLAVFYPGILGAMCCWLKLGYSRRVLMRWAVVIFTVAVLMFELHAVSRFSKRMQSPPLMVDRWLVQLQRVERMARFNSFNMLSSDGWSRLWANAFLLRKPQYFAVHTYEGRLNTALKGDWDLLCGVISIRLPEDGDGVPDYIDLSRTVPGAGPNRKPHPGPPPQYGPLPFSLVSTRSHYFIRAHLGSGWYDAEQIPRAGSRWRWTSGDAEILIENRHPYPLYISFRLKARSVVPRDLQIWMGGKQLRATHVGRELKAVRLGGVEIPPGDSVVQLRSTQPAVLPGGGDGRMLGFAAYGIELEVLSSREEPGP